MGFAPLMCAISHESVNVTFWWLVDECILSIQKKESIYKKLDFYPATYHNNGRDLVCKVRKEWSSYDGLYGGPMIAKWPITSKLSAQTMRKCSSLKFESLSNGKTQHKYMVKWLYKHKDEI